VFFALDVELLEEFFAWSEAGDLDLDVLTNLQPGKANHVGRQIDDADRLSHVQEQDFTCVADGAGLDDKPGGFGNGHEVALHSFVGDGDRSAGGDLLAEDLDDAAGGIEHVAEADGDEPAGGQFGQRLDVQFGRPLAGTHDAGRVDRLVGGDHHEGLHGTARGQVGQAPGGGDDVFDGFLRVELHEGDVLVGGGVEDDLGLIAREDLSDARFVQQVGQADFETDVGGPGSKLPFEEELARFVAVDEDDFLRGEVQKLAADLRADASSAAGDQQDAIVDPLADISHLQPHGIAAQEVVDGDRTRPDGDAADDELLVAGEDSDADGVLLSLVDEPSDLPAGESPGGDEDFADAVAFGEPAGLIDGADDADAADAATETLRVVVDEADDVIGEFSVSDDRSQQRFAGLVGPDDEGGHLVGGEEEHPVSFPGQSHHGAGSSEDDDGGSPIQQEDAAGNRVAQQEDAIHQNRDEKAAGGGLDKGDEVVEGDEPDPALVDAKPAEQQELDEHHVGDRGGESLPYLRGELAFESQPVAEIVDADEDRGQAGGAEELPEGAAQFPGGAPDVVGRFGQLG